MGQRLSDAAFPGSDDDAMMHLDRSEKIFTIGTIILLVIFAAAVAISSLAYGIQVPAPPEFENIDPRTVATPGVSPWGDPVEERVRELAPGHYEVYMLAQTWQFTPGSTFFGGDPLRIPAGSTVTFYITSKDIQHGFRLENTNINMMVIPGEVSTLTATFDEPGEYDFICHEYCGINHHLMYGQLIVEPNEG